MLEALDSFAPAKPLDELPLRLPVQAVYRMDYRIIAGRIESGELTVGDDIVVMPGNQDGTGQIDRSLAGARRTSARRQRRRRSIDRDHARSRAVRRSRRPHHDPSAPPETGRMLRARVFWLHPSR